MSTRTLRATGISQITTSSSKGDQAKASNQNGKDEAASAARSCIATQALAATYPNVPTQQVPPRDRPQPHEELLAIHSPGQGRLERLVQAGRRTGGAAPIRASRLRSARTLRSATSNRCSRNQPASRSSPTRLCWTSLGALLASVACRVSSFPGVCCAWRPES